MGSAVVIDAEVVLWAELGLTRDGSIRPDTTAAALARLKPAFRAEGMVKAGHSSPRSDGATALLIRSEASATKRGVERLAGMVAAPRSASTRTSPASARAWPSSWKLRNICDISERSRR